MIAAMIAATVLVALTILIHYEVLRITSAHLAELPVPPRARIIVVVSAAFVAHTLEVWLYGGGYWLLSAQLGLGGFGGVPVVTLEDYIYFSAVTYTSLGFGDVFPASHTRLIAGVESLNGLVLIGWSASFTYLAMERYWPLHPVRRTRRRHAAAAGDTARAPAAR
ncbi:MAG: two pore domain potassium channel family protein [Proteobacteria bacterium]|nr:two pore domain potassium channel family protein [Pseudomonadota bacterium]